MESLSEDYISETGRIITKDQLQFVTNSKNSSIWKYELEGKIYAFKKFYDDRYSYSLKYVVYQIMQKLLLKNIVKPLEGYKKISNTSEKSIDAYIMEYIFANLDFSFLDYPIEILLENIENLEKDIEQLSAAHIFMFDIGAKNSIISKDDLKLSIIDTDMYYYDRLSSISTILEENRRNIFNLIRIHLIRGLLNCQDLDKHAAEIKEFLKMYFNPDDTNESLYARVEGLFGNYETPKQCFLARKKF